VQQKAKSHVQPEYDEKRKGRKSPDRFPQTATANLTNSPYAGIERLSPANLVALQQTVGNRTVTNMIALRQREEDELSYPGPRNGRQADNGELTYPGPRLTRQRSDSGTRGGGSEGRSSSELRAAPSSSATGAIGFRLPLYRYQVSCEIQDRIGR
jgi:hypothetical protein